MITGNRTTLIPNAATGGVFGTQGSSLQIQGATINGNTGNGVFLNFQSNARMYDSIVNNNSGNGILLVHGAALLLQDPAVTVTGNALFGLQCGGTESSFSGNISGILGNTGGDVNPFCTGF